MVEMKVLFGWGCRKVAKLPKGGNYAVTAQLYCYMPVYLIPSLFNKGGSKGGS